MTMELRDIEYFAAVAQHGSIGRAAEHLGLSQPALSKSLRRLEKAMHAKVVKRTPKGVELTEVGGALLSQVRRLRLTLDDISREAADLSQGRAGHLRIGSVGGSGLHLVPMACGTLLKESPKVTLKMSVQETGPLLASLRNGELDLVVANLGAHHEDLVDEHTHDDALVIYASAKHPLAKRRSLTLADLAGQRWALPSTDSVSTRILIEELRIRGLPPLSTGVETAYLPARHHVVAATNLLAVGPRAIARYAAARFGIAVLRVKDLTLTRRSGVFYRKDAYLSPAARRFIEILKATAKEISG